MNQRREVRIQVNQSVTITIFGEPDIVISARVRNISGKGIGLELQNPVPPGAVLKVELPDALLLGEVIYCRKDEASHYAGVELEHSLCGLGELSRMVDAFDAAMATVESGSQRTHPVIEGRHKGQQQSH
jgi:hypothetical protein